VQIKLEREPMKLFIENGIEELTKNSLAEIESEKVNKDDVDVRLKWLGFFHRRKQHCRCPNSNILGIPLPKILVCFII